MSKIFITGASGFVGARVARLLIEDGRDVALLLRESSNTWRIDDLLDKCTVIRGTFFDCNLFRQEMISFAPKAVIHIAWDGVKSADRDNMTQIRNLTASIDLFNLAQEAGCLNFIGLGSQAEYGLMGGQISEGFPTNPVSMYGATKLATGVVLNRASITLGVQFAWLRLFSSYGSGDDGEWLLPYVIDTLLKGQVPTVTKCEQIWDYIHVDDVAEAIIATLDSQARGIFNLGSGTAYPLRSIIEQVRDHINPLLPINFGGLPYSKNQVMHLESDISSLTKATRWRPKIALNNGIADLVEEVKNKPIEAKIRKYI